MPYDRTRYPRNWDEIARHTKARAGWRCENCGHPNRVDPDTGTAYDDGWRACDHNCTHPDQDGKQRLLTVHHLDGDPMNCADHNLVALCQVCHLHWQAKYHPGQYPLDFLPDWLAWRGEMYDLLNYGAVDRIWHEGLLIAYDDFENNFNGMMGLSRMPAAQTGVDLYMHGFVIDLHKAAHMNKESNNVTAYAHP